MIVFSSITPRSAIRVRLLFLLSCFTLCDGQSSQFVQPQGVTVTTDADCVLALDGKFVGRVHKGHPGVLAMLPGKHELSAATASGDYFKQSVDTLMERVQSISISFEELRRERVAKENELSDLRRKVGQAQQELLRRRAIVSAVNYYADRWGKELGISEDLNQTAADLDHTVSIQGMQNAANPDTATQAATEALMVVELFQYRHLKAKAHLSGFVGAVASRHLEYLRKALNDPLAYGPDREDLGYLTMVHLVTHHGETGKLLTAPDQLEYSDASGRIRIPCTSVRGAKGDGELHVTYDNATQKRKTLVVRARERLERQMLLGDVYLACPNLLQ